MFVGNFSAYATLAVALVLPVAPLPRLRPFTRTMLTAIPVASIVSYYHVDVLDLLGSIDKITEVLLIVLVTINAEMSGQELGGRYPRGVLGIGMFLFLRPPLV